MSANTQGSEAMQWIRQLALATAVAATMGLSACGGGSDSAPSAVLPGLITAKSCNNITGALDVVQNAITGQLKPAAQSIPVIGGAAATATTALNQTLDVVDVLVSALTTLASTQNPQLFTAKLPGIGDSLLCAGASLSDALAQLATAQSIPGLDQVQLTLARISQQVADGLVGTTPGGDLKVLTGLLSALALQVNRVVANLPVPADQAYLKQVLTLTANSFNSVALILDDLGALNGAKLSSDVVALLQSTLDGLLLPANQLGLPANALSPVTNQLKIVTGSLGNTLTAIAAPTLQAVAAVLGAIGIGVNGTPTQIFSDVLEGSLSNTVAALQPSRLTQLILALNGGPLLNLLSALLQSFGGVLPR